MLTPRILPHLGPRFSLQDYNRSVLTRLTTQNVSANAAAWAARQALTGGAGADAHAAARARYFAGSWDALPGLLAAAGLQHSYDVVLTAGSYTVPLPVEYTESTHLPSADVGQGGGLAGMCGAKRHEQDGATLLPLLQSSPATTAAPPCRDNIFA